MESVNRRLKWLYFPVTINNIFWYINSLNYFRKHDHIFDPILLMLWHVTQGNLEIKWIAWGGREFPYASPSQTTKVIYSIFKHSNCRWSRRLPKLLLNQAVLFLFLNDDLFPIKSYSYINWIYYIETFRWNETEIN